MIVVTALIIWDKRYIMDIFEIDLSAAMVSLDEFGYDSFSVRLLTRWRLLWKWMQRDGLSLKRYATTCITLRGREITPDTTLLSSWCLRVYRLRLHCGCQQRGDARCSAYDCRRWQSGDSHQAYWVEEIGLRGNTDCWSMIIRIPVHGSADNRVFFIYFLSTREKKTDSHILSYQ